jgi:hypothetical protein
MCANMRIMTGTGVVLESIQDIGLAHTVMTDLSTSADYEDHNAVIQYNGARRPSYRNGNPVSATDDPSNYFRLAALDLSGVLHQGKLIHANSLGGLVIELDLADPKVCFGTRAAAGTDVIDYTFTDVTCRFMDVTVSDSERIAYENDVVGPGAGYALVIQTFTTLQNVVTSLQQSVSLPKRANKVKAIMSVHRPQVDLVNRRSWPFSRTSQGFVEYQYTINGQEYPTAPCSTYQKAHEEALKITYNHKNCLYAGPSFREWTDDYSIDTLTRVTTTTDVLHPISGEQFAGKFVMGYDFEKQQGALSGTPMTGTGDTLHFDFTNAIANGTAVGGAANPDDGYRTLLQKTAGQITSFILHERVISIAKAGVSVYD